MKSQIYIQITKNKIVNKTIVRKAFEVLKDGRYQLTIESKNNRSNPQNRYYWSGVIPLVKDGLKEVGYLEIDSNESVHDLMKYMFLKKQIVNELTGEVIETIGSTTKLSTIEFMEYVDRISQFAAEMLGVSIPPPSTQTELFFTESFK